MMTLHEIENGVIAILATQLLVTPDDIAADAMIDTLGLDSLGKVEAIFALEEHFGIAIPFNANETDRSDFDFDSVPGIVASVERLIAQRSA